MAKIIKNKFVVNLLTIYLGFIHIVGMILYCWSFSGSTNRIYIVVGLASILSNWTKFYLIIKIKTYYGFVIFLKYLSPIINISDLIFFVSMYLTNSDGISDKAKYLYYFEISNCSLLLLFELSFRLLLLYDIDISPYSSKEVRYGQDFYYGLYTYDDAIIVDNDNKHIIIGEKIGFKTEDAHCIFSLSNYANGDIIGLLRCGHHATDEHLKVYFKDREECPICKHNQLLKHANDYITKH